MLQRMNRVLLALILVGTVTIMLGSSPAIGLVVAKGNFQVDHSRIWGNATLFEGNTIETGKAPSQLQLNSGAQVQLASESRAKVYQGRAVLEKGISQIEYSSSYELEARTLRISAATPTSIARVRLTGPNSVIVAAMAGAVRVTNAQGMLVANVEAGRAVTFEPQAGAAAPTKIMGCLLKKDGKYVVVDQVTTVTREVQGEGLEKELGNRVEVTGTEENQVVKIANLREVAKGGCASTAKKIGAIGAAGAAGAAAATGLGTGAVVAIVGGVAAASTVGGLAAAGTFSGGEAPAPASR